jgi:competence protein ComFC
MLLQSRCAGCHRPGDPLCRTCRFALVAPSRNPARAASRAPLCRSSTGTEVVIAAVPFSGRARDVVLGLKYRNRRQLGHHLAGLLVNRVLAEGLRPGIDFDMVTWAPTSAKRRRQRGFDQSELVARRVALQLNLSCRRLLERTGDDTAQTGLSRVQRLHGPSFRVRPDTAGRRVLLIDDVVTTGSTLRAAAATLRRAGAVDVHCAAIAATPSGVSGRTAARAQVVTGPWSRSSPGLDRSFAVRQSRTA